MKTSKHITTLRNLALKASLVLAFIGVGAATACSDNDKEPQPDPVEYVITLDKASQNIHTGDELTVTPSFSSVEMSGWNYTWSSSAPTVASVSRNSDNSGKIVAVSAGTATISIVYNQNSSIRAEISVTVTERPDGIVRILAIGNSFSQDAVEQYLHELAEAEGIQTVIGNLYIGGATLETHVKNARNNNASYEYHKIQDGNKTSRANTTLATALADEKWDYISLQQQSGKSGIFSTYESFLPELANYAKQHSANSEATLMIHQTWAYAATSTHDEFPAYDKNQIKMYEAIVQTVNKAADLIGVNMIIPAGTAIQNGRTSFLGDTFTRDGYHLEVTYGRYTAACTWFEKIFGRNVVGNSYAPAGLDNLTIEIAQHAAHAAVLEPNKVTVLENYVTPPTVDVMKAPVYIDFGSASYPTKSPWNNFTSSVPLDEAMLLKDEDGDYTVFTVNVTKNFNDVFNGVGSEPTTPMNPGFEVPASAFRDGFIVNSTQTTGEITLSNLDPALEYTMTIIGLRWNSSYDRNTDYTVTGKDSRTYTLAVGTNVAEQVMEKYITIDRIQPDADGNIAIAVNLSADNTLQAIISALRISVAQ